MQQPTKAVTTHLVMIAVTARIVISTSMAESKICRPISGDPRKSFTSTVSAMLLPLIYPTMKMYVSIIFIICHSWSLNFCRDGNKEEAAVSAMIVVQIQQIKTATRTVPIVPGFKSTNAGTKAYAVSAMHRKSSTGAHTIIIMLSSSTGTNSSGVAGFATSTSINRIEWGSKK